MPDPRGRRTPSESRRRRGTRDTGRRACRSCVDLPVEIGGDRVGGFAGAADAVRDADAVERPATDEDTRRQFGAIRRRGRDARRGTAASRAATARRRRPPALPGNGSSAARCRAHASISSASSASRTSSSPAAPTKQRSTARSPNAGRATCSRSTCSRSSARRRAAQRSPTPRGAPSRFPRGRRARQRRSRRTGSARARPTPRRAGRAARPAGASTVRITARAPTGPSGVRMRHRGLAALDPATGLEVWTLACRVVAQRLDQPLHPVPRARSIGPAFGARVSRRGLRPRSRPLRALPPLQFGERRPNRESVANARVHPASNGAIARSVASSPRRQRSNPPSDSSASVRRLRPIRSRSARTRPARELPGHRNASPGRSGSRTRCGSGREPGHVRSRRGAPRARLDQFVAESEVAAQVDRPGLAREERIGSRGHPQAADRDTPEHPPSSGPASKTLTDGSWRRTRCATVNPVTPPPITATSAVTALRSARSARAPGRPAAAGLHRRVGQHAVPQVEDVPIATARAQHVQRCALDHVPRARGARWDRGSPGPRATGPPTRSHPVERHAPSSRSRRPRRAISEQLARPDAEVDHRHAEDGRPRRTTGACAAPPPLVVSGARAPAHESKIWIAARRRPPAPRRARR